MLKQRLLQIVRGCKSWEDIHQKIKLINNDDHLLAGNLFHGLDGTRHYSYSTGVIFLEPRVYLSPSLKINISE
jgi:hypothetical protein